MSCTGRAALAPLVIRLSFNSFFARTVTHGDPVPLSWAHERAAVQQRAPLLREAAQAGGSCCLRAWVSGHWPPAGGGDCARGAAGIQGAGPSPARCSGHQEPALSLTWVSTPGRCPGQGGSLRRGALEPGAGVAREGKRAPPARSCTCPSMPAPGQSAAG